MTCSYNVVLLAALLAAGPAIVLAQPAVPDSTMGGVTVRARQASNGIGTEGILGGDAGSHGSTLSGPAAAAQIPVRPKPAAKSGNDPQLEGDPALGGGQQH
jgi:hypothetical protein